MVVVVKHKVDRDLFVVIYYASAPALVIVVSVCDATKAPCWEIERRLAYHYVRDHTYESHRSMFASRGDRSRRRVLAAWSLTAAAV
jgi:hypothetical protein